MARFIVGVKVARNIITVPIKESATGCIIATDKDCCGSGSGSGSGGCPIGCVVECPVCISTARRWEFSDPNNPIDIVVLCHIEDPNDGNFCRWVSTDLTWELVVIGSLFILRDFTTGARYFRTVADWDCKDANNMEAFDESTSVTVFPVDICGITSWNCVPGEGSGAKCVEIEGGTGTYTTKADCIAASCGSGSTFSTVCDACIGGIACNQYLVRIEGIEDGPFCGNCSSAFNKTHILTYTPFCLNDCAWRAANDDPCPGIGPFELFLYYGSLPAAVPPQPANWYLVVFQNCAVDPVGTSPIVLYQVSGTFDCLGTNTFELAATAGNPGICTNWPSTLTVTANC